MASPHRPNPAVNRTACKLRLQVPSAFGSGGRLLLRYAYVPLAKKNTST